jgi:predicted transcriptional regulator
MDDKISDDEIWQIFASKYPKRIKQKIQTLNQKELDDFQKSWQKEFTSYRGRYKKAFFDYKKEADYKFCLFDIVKNHWNKEDGFNINMKRSSDRINKSVATVNRMILFFIECGLLKRVHNYMAGKQSYFYYKNTVLFNHCFRGGISNDFNDWLNTRKINNIVYSSSKNSNQLYQYIYTNVITNKNQNKTRKGPNSVKNNINVYDYIYTNVITNKNQKITNKPNVELLQNIIMEFFPIIETLNKGQHEDLQIDFDLHFDDKGNYSGRSKSYF